MEGLLFLRYIFPILLVPTIVTRVKGDIRSLNLFSMRGRARYLELLKAIYTVHNLVFLVFDEIMGIPESLIIIITIKYLIKLWGSSGALLLGLGLVWGSYQIVS